MPDLASRSAAVTSLALLPIEETTPIPVTTTRRIKASFRSAQFFRIEQTHAQVRRRVDRVPVGFEHAVRNTQNELAQNHPLQVDLVDDTLNLGRDLTGELHLADAKGAAFAGRAGPAQVKP